MVGVPSKTDFASRGCRPTFVEPTVVTTAPAERPPGRGRVRPTGLRSRKARAPCGAWRPEGRSASWESERERRSRAHHRQPLPDALALGGRCLQQVYRERPMLAATNSGWGSGKTRLALTYRTARGDATPRADHAIGLDGGRPRAVIEERPREPLVARHKIEALALALTDELGSSRRAIALWITQIGWPSGNECRRCQCLISNVSM